MFRGYWMDRNAKISSKIDCALELRVSLLVYSVKSVFSENTANILSLVVIHVQ